MASRKGRTVWKWDTDLQILIKYIALRLYEAGKMRSGHTAEEAMYHVCPNWQFAFKVDPKDPQRPLPTYNALYNRAHKARFRENRNTEAPESEKNKEFLYLWDLSEVVVKSQRRYKTSELQVLINKAKFAAVTDVSVTAAMPPPPVQSYKSWEQSSLLDILDKSNRKAFVMLDKAEDWAVYGGLYETAKAIVEVKKVLTAEYKEMRSVRDD